MNDISGENKAGAADVSASQHVMVCALKELGSLVQSLSATASPLIQEPSIGGTLHVQWHMMRLFDCYLKFQQTQVLLITVILTEKEMVFLYCVTLMLCFNM